MRRVQSGIHSSEDARRLARARLPRLVFDFVDGAAGREAAAARNGARFDEVLLQPRAMADVAERSLRTAFRGREYDLPFGIAPMGMCNLVRPGADEHLARAAAQSGFPLGVSSAASSPLEDVIRWADGNAWFQLYFSESAEASLAAAERARAAGYETLTLTVDVPQVSRRIRDLRNGFDVPFRMTPRAFADFAMHPRWSLATLAAGVPHPRNMAGGGEQARFDRSACRAGADWAFLRRLRDAWPGDLIVKGVLSAEDARRVQSLGADAIQVSNHGGRQLDGAPAAIDALPLVRRAVGPEFPLVFDSGVRSGEDVVRALALGADFAMIGRPALFALAAEGRAGLDALIDCLAQDVGVAMAQIGVRSTEEIDARALFADPAAGDATGRPDIHLAAGG